jgi:phospholipase/carboxylesterase
MLSYRIKKATQSKGPHPALILIHGYGSNMDDLFSFANYLPEQYTIISLQAPLDSPFGGSAWYSINFDPNLEKWSDNYEAKISLNKISDQLDYFTSTYELNPNDISLIGFSQGAILSWALLLDHPLLYRRAICMSGYINQEILQKPLGEYHDILAYGSHGSNDVTIPYDWAKSSIECLKKNNPEVVFNIYPDGHNISPENFESILNWIKKTTLG